MENKNTIFVAMSISICIFCIFFTVFLFRRVKSVEFEFNKKEASLIKETMDMRDFIEGLEETVRKKTKEISAVKAEKEKIFEKIKSIEKETEKIQKLYTEQTEKLKKEGEALQAEIKTLKEISLADVIRKTLDAEKDANIKKVLERTLHNIELIRSGNFVDLEPIVVSEKIEEGSVETSAEPVSLLRKNVGEILSIDRDNNLVVINLGAEDKVEEGQQVSILKDGEEIASGEIIGTRYKISAALIDNVQYRYTLSDIKRGSKVLLR